MFKRVCIFCRADTPKLLRPVVDQASTASLADLLPQPEQGVLTLTLEDPLTDSTLALRVNTPNLMLISNHKKCLHHHKFSSDIFV